LLTTTENDDMNTMTTEQPLALQTAGATTLAAPSAFSMAPTTMQEAMDFADMLAQSDLVPKDFQRKPGNVLVAMQWGAEIGLKPLQALQNIAVINGRPAVWGDALLALVRSSPACEYVVESEEGDTAVCRVKRRGEPEQVRTFSVADAKTAGLSGKGGPWSNYPKRMRQMRARAYALRDVFADVLKGMPVAEEVMDMPPQTGAPRHMGPAPTVPQAAPEMPAGLLEAAENAAAEGVAAYGEFFSKAGKDGRKALADHHPRLKQAAIDADAARTVEMPAASAEPGLDVAALLKRVESCTDAQVLLLIGDDVATLPAGADREQLEAAIAARGEALEA
jgi:hypothetical protein